MLLSDRGIKSLIDSGNLSAASPKSVGVITYDLTTDHFSDEVGAHSEYLLKPGCSVFVGSKEIVDLPANLTARVLLKNSRVRQGLTLDTPLYFPGHKTVLYFHITNVSGDEIRFNQSSSIVQVAFERVDEIVVNPPNETFNKEFNYKGMARHSPRYSAWSTLI